METISALDLKTETQSAAFATAIAPILRAGDVVLLDGPIGSGKSHFARAVIRHLVGADIEVPSPTFTLVQTYENSPEIWHADLYRLSSPDEAIELGLEDAFSQAICLIEWPDRLGDLTPVNALRIEMRAGENSHSATIKGDETWQKRLRDFHVCT